MNENDVMRMIKANAQVRRAQTHRDYIPGSDELASPFGCCNFFDVCSDGFFSLYYRGSLDLLDWMGFNPTDVCLREVEFIDYVRPEQYGQADTAGYLADCCTDPNGIEFGACKLSVDHFGLYGREGPERCMLKPKFYCKSSPRRFLDGTPVDSEWDWDMLLTMDTMLNDIRVGLITGNHANAGQFDGLQRWVRTGYDCHSLDSYVINWNNNGLAGGAGITLNGQPAPTGFNLVDWLLDIHRNVKERVSWSPLLKNQKRAVGDTIIMLPGFLARCLLDFYTCWSVCPENLDTTQDATRIVKELGERRDFRIQLNGGLFGMGRIYLDGDEIPLLVYDWGMINGPTRGDMYYLTGQVGTQRIWEGEFLSSANVLQEMVKAYPGAGGAPFFSQDNGRVVGTVDLDNLCRTIKLWMSLRLWCFAPWAQARFQNVACHTPTGPLSPNPVDTSFNPVGTSFNPAVCP
jgi:hypothetical protein